MILLLKKLLSCLEEANYFTEDELHYCILQCRLLHNMIAFTHSSVIYGRGNHIL